MRWLRLSRAIGLLSLALLVVIGLWIMKAYFFPTKAPFLPLGDTTHAAPSIATLGPMPPGLRITSTATWYDGMSELFGTKYASVTVSEGADVIAVARLRDVLLRRGWSERSVDGSGTVTLSKGPFTVSLGQEPALLRATRQGHDGAAQDFLFRHWRSGQAADVPNRFLVALSSG